MAVAMTPVMMMEPGLDVDKLSYEIFSILESKFLFGYDDPKLFLAESSPETPANRTPRPPSAGGGGKVRILSIDGGGRPSDGLLAAASLARLESSLRRRTGDPSARVSDFFDVAAGSGAGGVLVAMLFTKGADGNPLFSADEALSFFAKHHRSSSTFSTKKGLGLFRGRLFRRSGGIFRRVLGDATLKDTVKPVLIPCYDLATGAPFLFSRADAVETDGYDFKLRDVCAATCADPAVAPAGCSAVEMRSLDGRTRIVAVGGGVAMGNPAAAAITHVLNNKQEFPFAVEVEDLVVLSLGTASAAEFGGGPGRATPSAAELVRIAGEGAAIMVDEAVAMAFGQSSTSNYVRIQANVFGAGNCTPKPGTVNGGRKLIGVVENILSERNVESLLFRGKKISEQTNMEKLERFAGELIKEKERRKKSLGLPTVVLKQVMTPRTSTSTVTTATTTSTRSSASPCYR